MSRHVAREVAFKIVFEMAFNDETSEELYSKFLECNEKNFEDVNDEDKKYIQEVINGIKENISAIDDMIKSKLKDWNFERISKIDLSVLRLAIYELLYREDIPVKVAVNEAVEICKVFGEETSPNFVNGVLAQVIREKK